MKTLNTEKEKRFTYIVFGIYMILLVWLVLFKFAVSIEEIPRMRNINLIPFYYDRDTSFHFKEVLYNVIVFIPAGFYFTAFLEKRGRWHGVIATALLSVLFESMQWVFCLGSTDITDVITNTLGGLGGMFLFWITGKIFLKYRFIIINVIGFIIEILACLLLALLIFSN